MAGLAADAGQAMVKIGTVAAMRKEAVEVETD